MCTLGKALMASEVQKQSIVSIEHSTRKQQFVLVFSKNESKV